MKILTSFIYAFNGLKLAICSEKNFQIELALGLLSIVSGVMLHVDKTEWLAIIICNAMVLSFELINTAIEKICDFIHIEYHPQVKAIKDIAAAAVLITATASLVIASIIFLPKIFILTSFY